MSILILKEVVFNTELGMWPSPRAPELRVNVGTNSDYIPMLYGYRYKLWSLSLGYTPWQEYDTTPLCEVLSLGKLDVGYYDSPHSVCRLEEPPLQKSF